MAFRFKRLKSTSIVSGNTCANNSQYTHHCFSLFYMLVMHYCCFISINRVRVQCNNIAKMIHASFINSSIEGARKYFISFIIY
ncbi:Uncharacterised protein [Enterobacter hormaechei]|nr:Uncharacterised protein [Enterobacter hormaechei]CZV04147.1 Uncharacterised protein [Enterobacter hormaechei]CZW92570.1 Uncharacterised protein [Enterobacter hormaechei]CZX29454.1 Uncharacterised protein [Enterobacter hormaechei]CZX54931.1 Uncharacterised protein [Enterobacter hormaechei]